MRALGCSSVLQLRDNLLSGTVPPWLWSRFTCASSFESNCFNATCAPHALCDVSLAPAIDHNAVHAETVALVAAVAALAIPVLGYVFRAKLCPKMLPKRVYFAQELVGSADAVTVRVSGSLSLHSGRGSVDRGRALLQAFFRSLMGSGGSRAVDTTPHVINVDDLTFQQPIGFGGQGEIHLAKWGSSQVPHSSVRARRGS